MTSDTAAEQPEPVQAPPVPAAGAQGALALVLAIVLALAAAYICFVLTVYHLSQGQRTGGLY